MSYAQIEGDIKVPGSLDTITPGVMNIPEDIRLVKIRFLQARGKQAP